jgi:ABC-type methionine transport system ATPase subunit
MLEKLALSRAKGNETRRKNKEARLKGEMPTPTQKKKIVKEQEEEKKRPVVNNIVHETKNITNNITHEDIEKIVNQSTKKTLEEYETVRKQRKAAKQIVKHKEIEQEKVKKTILAAQGYAYGQPNFYANCFG